MKRFSLRWLLVGAVLGTITIAFTGFAVYLDSVEQGNRLNDLDAELVRAERTETAPQRGPDPRVEPGVDGGVVDPPVQLILGADGTVVAASGSRNPFSQATLAMLAEGSGNLSTADPRYRISLTRTPDGLVVVTALSLDDFDAAVERFRTGLAVGGGVILVLVAAVLWALTGFLTRPVARMAEAANRIAAGDLDNPVGPPAGSRETADLAVDLDRMVARLRGTLGEANLAHKATERLLADLAHEIRTPLTALKGYSDLYAQGMLENTSDVDRAMSRIGSESERLNELANAMLELANGSTAQHEVEGFDLDELAEEVVADLRAAYPDQRIDLQVGSGSFRLSGSRNRIQQAILNLGSNACHHNPGGEAIIVAVQRNDGTVGISVADRGKGIDPADRERVFLPFYRSDSARNRDGQNGAGLGLALVQQIAHQHGGTVSVHSTCGGGATFTLSVPELYAH